MINYFFGSYFFIQAYYFSSHVLYLKFEYYVFNLYLLLGHTIIWITTAFYIELLWYYFHLELLTLLDSYTYYFFDCIYVFAICIISFHFSLSLTIVLYLLSSGTLILFWVFFSIFSSLSPLYHPLLSMRSAFFIA